jgi:hypothetical protein
MTCLAYFAAGMVTMLLVSVVGLLLYAVSEIRPRSRKD